MHIVVFHSLDIVIHEWWSCACLQREISPGGRTLWGWGEKSDGQRQERLPVAVCSAECAPESDLHVRRRVGVIVQDDTWFGQRPSLRHRRQRVQVRPKNVTDLSDRFVCLATAPAHSSKHHISLWNKVEHGLTFCSMFCQSPLQWPPQFVLHHTES